MIRTVEHRRKFKDRFGANCTIYHFGKQRGSERQQREGRTEGSRASVRWGSACSLMDGGDSISIALVNPPVTKEVQGSAKRCFLGCVDSLLGSAWI